MPRGRKRTVEEQRAWLKAYESGAPLQEIATASKRALSTVWTGIQAARVERDDTSVKQGLLSDAYRQHQRDLLSAADVLAAPVVPNGMDTPEQLLLTDALRIHLPDAPIWALLADRDHSTSVIYAIKESLESAFEGLIDAAPERVRSCVNREGAARSLHLAADRAAAEATTSGMTYDFSQDSLSWGAYALAERSGDEETLEAVRVLHEGWLAQISGFELTGELRTAKLELDHRHEELALEVARMRLRHVIPGFCEMCPGYRHVSSPRRRRRRKGRQEP